MFETVATYRRQAESVEADLMTRTTDLATLIDPPFSLAKRRRIRGLLDATEGPRGQLYRIWAAQMMTAEARALPFGHPDRRYFLAVDGRLRLWTQTQALLDRVLKAGPLPLLPDEPPATSPEYAQLLAYQRCFDRLHGYFSPTPPDLYAAVTGRHGDLPYPFTGFLRLMQMIRRLALAMGRTGQVSFLDMGCGVGLKLVQAAEFFDVVHGVEYDAERAEVAGSLIERSRRAQDRATQGDALTFDDYGQYDVIYAYKPLSDPELLQAMERRMIAQARPDTILILPYFEIDFRFDDLGLTRLSDKVFVTGGAGRDLTQVLQKAGHIGTILPQAVVGLPGAEGFTEPLRQALRHWGHLA